jgi:ribonucleoside-diphosphate reductase alpha chain
MAELSTNARRVLEARYLARDETGATLEDWEGLCSRVARGVAAAEREFSGDADGAEESFFALLARREFLPNSPTLMNAGTALGQLAACFVVPVEDDLASIFEAVKRMAVIHQTGGGTGFDFSRLRPAGDAVQRTHGVASGPVSFIGVFDATTSVIKQGGRRRGANMGVMRVDHPDILAFVRAKAASKRLTNFNLSVTTPDAFWEAVESGGAVDLVQPRDGKLMDSLDASALLDEIAEQAWAGGDPGVIFLDAVNRGNPTPRLGALEATNPCGELPLLPNEACNLGSIRLDAFVREGVLDWERLGACVDLAVRFLDDVVEVSRYPFPEVADIVRGNRKIGLGVMGFADLLVDLGIPYDADEAAAFADGLMRRIRARAEAASARLAEERGPFPNWEGSQLEKRGLRLRNATVTSIAPTGSLSILADCSGGIEPYFALAFVRHVLDGARLRETNRRFDEALRRAGAWSEDLVAEVRANGSARGIAGVPEAVRRLFPVAGDMAPERHLAIQEAFQRHVDNAVSKTINLPADASPGDVRAIYLSAWRRGLKGVTVFREGARAGAVLVRGAGGEIEVPAEHAGGCREDRCP